MTQQRVIDLEEMDKQQAEHFLSGPLSRLDPEGEYDARHRDFVMEMPQSGERFRGRENLRAMQEAYPTHGRSPGAAPSTIRLRRVLVREGLWVAEASYLQNDRRVADVVLIFELRDGKMWRDRWYFAEPFEAPAWRARWVERMEP